MFSFSWKSLPNAFEGSSFLLWTKENLRPVIFKDLYALSVPAKIILQKRIVFVFLVKKADHMTSYCKVPNVFTIAK